MMERAGRVLGKLKLSDHGIGDEELARSAWPLAVGKRIASRTGHVSLVRSRLVVEVEDAIWQRQLFTLRGQILAKMEQTWAVLLSPSWNSASPFRAVRRSGKRRTRAVWMTPTRS
jgi:Protein of unknown function (DUF721).